MLMRTAEDEEEARDSSVSSSLARQGSSHSPTHTQVSEMPNADEDALRAIRAASTALQEQWPEGESPRSWDRVEWSDDRVQKLDLHRSWLEELPPQIGQLTALTELDLEGCEQLKELPPQIGQLTALTGLDLGGCRQLKELPCALWNCYKRKNA